MRPHVVRVGLLAVVTALVVTVGVLGSEPVAGAQGRPSAVGLPGSLPVAPGLAPTGSRVAMAPAFVVSPGEQAMGPADPSATMTVDVGLASRDPSGLAAFVDATAVPGLPSFHRYLSAAAAESRFGAPPSAVAAASDYFDGFGLTAAAHPDGLILSVEGPTAAVARAFGTTLGLFRDPSGSPFVAPTAPATLPAVAPWTGVLGLTGLEGFTPQVRSVPFGPEAGPGCGAFTGVLSPCQVADAYGISDLYALGQNGTGERIAVIDTYSASENQSRLASDVSAFSRTFALAPVQLSFAYPVPTSVNLNTTPGPAGWDVEDPLDVEWAHASAPGASIEMVYSPNAGAGLYFAIDWVVAQDNANVLSMSWGEPEVGTFNAEAPPPCTAACNASSDGSFAILDPVLELAAAEGISTFAASGDCGSADGTSGVAVSFPASDPYVTGVGATNLTLNASGGYGSETAWGGNGTGAVPPGCANQGGSGGGFSVLPRPWWQTGSGTVASLGRGVPDVGIVGGKASPVEIVYGGGSTGAVAGTSVGTPVWAGIAATVDQAAGVDLGWLNPSLYRILASANYTTDFHPVKSGSNGYPARTGWNPVTGIGTPIVVNLTRDLAGTRLAPSDLAPLVYVSPRFGPAPLSAQVAVAVSGGTGVYPLEGVAFGDDTAGPTPGGVGRHTFDAAGVYSVQAYVVDSGGNVSTSPPVVVAVGGGGPLLVHLSSSNGSPALNATVAFTATASGGSGPYAYNFSFGDGSFADNLTAGSVDHVYRAAGAFCAEVVVRDAGVPARAAASPRVAEAVGGGTPGGCGNPTDPLTITTSGAGTVRDAPADFPGLFVVTGGSTAPAGLRNQFSLASGDPYTAACACSILRSAGNYTLHAWANDSVNGAAAATANVTVAPPLVGAFSASKLAGLVPLTVTFNASASGGVGASAGATHWSFGNGLGASGSFVSTTYTSPGEYVAIASLSDRGHGNASEAFVIDAESPTAPGVGVTATVTPAVNVSSGETVAWSASRVGPPAALARTLLAWQFGNGGSAFGPAANETVFSPSDVPAGDRLTAYVELDNAIPSPILRVALPLPGFFAQEAGGFVPAVDALGVNAVFPAPIGLVPFSVTGSVNATGPGGTTVTWTFGDGTNSSAVSFHHVYYGAGEYTVRLQAHDGYADSAVRRSALVANAALAIAGCGPSGRHVAPPYTLHLEPTVSGGTGPPYGFLWTLPNGTQSNATNVTLTFSSAGTYGLTLVVTDAASAAFTCSWAIVVVALPPVTFLEIVAGGVLAGIVLAVVFVVVTRPPPGD